MSVGGFNVTITPQVGANAEKLAYVDSGGKTAYYVGSAAAANLVSNVSPSDIGLVAEEESSVAITISYEGTETDPVKVLAAWTQLGKTKITFTLTVGESKGRLAAHGSHAYASDATTLTFTNIPLGTVSFDNSGTVGVYTVPNTSDNLSYLYAIRGADSEETGETITISVVNDAALAA